MSGRHYVIQEARGLLRASGADAHAFLQGMVSNDLDRLAPERALWAAFLTPQGKFLHEFFLTLGPGGDGEAPAIHLEGERARLDDLKTRLGRYRLRSKVDFADVSERYAVASLFGEGAIAALDLAPEPGRAKPFEGGLAYVDPRLAELGARAVLPAEAATAALEAAGFAAAEPAAYDRLRISLGVPDGSRDLEVERSPLLENGFDELHGIDWHKGCFMGQELTARTKYRALIKKRLVPVEFDGPAPEPGTTVTADGKDVGTLRSVVDGRGLALLRLESLDARLSAGGTELRARKPGWATF